MTTAATSGQEVVVKVRRGTIALIAICCGTTVANIYVAHPILGLLAAAFGVPDADTGLIVTISQVSYAAGLFFLVPLGDVVRRKRLLATLITGASIGLLLAAFALNMPMLAIATVIISALTCAPHVLIPFAVAITPPERRGRTLAAINMGMTGGIVLSRIVFAAIGDWFGWSAVYLFAAFATVVVGAIAVILLPTEPKRQHVAYPRLIASTLRLLVEQPTVRWAVAFQIPVFAAFNFIWVMIVFLLTDNYGLSVAAAGLFGLFSLVSMISAPFVGRYVDARGSLVVMRSFLGVLILGAAVMLFSETHIAFAIAGLILLNLGQQATGISNQTRVLSLIPAARSRINTLYMTSNFIGGALASLLAVWIFGHFGWRGITIGAFISCLVAAGVFALEQWLTKRKQSAG